eukprot:TRINITY_DN29240_c0_g1_i2.p1 TRINITY_DN29240_c0_g1~~TRINITY_DN29240_c0_g1_i2.p1  ORF type:complete len:224 (+),score=23.98 TRINITY_DN29240_c0_g1_i2:62-733(+)
MPMRPPSVVVFDLDNCVWDPEMYQLYSGPPFTYDSSKNTCTTSSSRGGGETVQLLGDVPEIFELLRFDGKVRDFVAQLEERQGNGACGSRRSRIPRFPPEMEDLNFGQNTVIAIASCCDEPSWAREILQKFRVTGSSGDGYGEVIGKTVTHTEIFKSNKKEHLGRIQKASGGIPFTDMVFFDDQHGNIRSVSSLGVTSIVTPSGGVTWNHFIEAVTKMQSAKM